MEALSCRLLPYAVADGAANMAADEVLLEAAVSGIASLRFYGWSSATISLGYFQSSAARLQDPRIARLPWVRRPSGGAALLHHHELTYALALPPGKPWQPDGSWLTRMHTILQRAIADWAVADCSQATAESLATSPTQSGEHPFFCFRQVTPGDLLLSAAKVVGSAQRRQRQCLLQHGAILLRQSEHASHLLGLCDLNANAKKALEAGGIEPLVEACGQRFVEMASCEIQNQPWRPGETTRIQELAEIKYRSDVWNSKR